MAEPTLALALADLQAEVGFFLGWGRGMAAGEGAWTASATASINSCVKTGLRQFYNPPLINGVGYEWSWKYPVASLSLLSGYQYVTLPDDFGGLEGPVLIAASASRVSRPIPVVGDVNKFYIENPSAAGPPMFAEIRPTKGSTLTTGQRSALYVFPQADQAYTLSVRYYFTDNALTTLLPYHSGGAQHAETVKASCLAAAELHLDGERGPLWLNFMERLASSIDADRRNKPQKLGYNRDLSDGRELRYGRGVSQVGGITYLGVEY